MNVLYVGCSCVTSITYFQTITQKHSPLSPSLCVCVSVCVWPCVCVCVCVNAQSFSVVFEMAIMTTEPAEEVKQRVLNLIDEITYSVFMYTNRSLFEKDKLTFIAQ